MKLFLLIGAVCVFVVAALLGFAVEDFALRDLLAVACIGLAAFAGSFLPV